VRRTMKSHASVAQGKTSKKGKRNDALQCVAP
jgi:hypothetical protein